MPQLHNLEVKVNGGDAVPPTPIPEMKVGDTVRYFSNAGKVTIVFPQLSPFRTDADAMTEITGADVQTVARNGDFSCRCFVTLPNGTTVGWQKDPSLSGGTHHVGH